MGLNATFELLGFQKLREPATAGFKCVGWLRGYCAVATRYEKHALNYLELLKLSMLRRYLRLLSRLAVLDYKLPDSQIQSVERRCKARLVYPLWR